MRVQPGCTPVSRSEISLGVDRDEVVIERRVVELDELRPVSVAGIAAAAESESRRAAGRQDRFRNRMMSVAGCDPGHENGQTIHYRTRNGACSVPANVSKSAVDPPGTAKNQATNLACARIFRLYDERAQVSPFGVSALAASGSSVGLVDDCVDRRRSACRGRAPARGSRLPAARARRSAPRARRSRGGCA